VERVHGRAVLDPERDVDAVVGPAAALADPEEGEVVAEPAISAIGSIMSLSPSGASAFS
jgi:hypothetical protein